MSIGISVKIDTTVLDRIANRLDTNVQNVGKKLGAMVEGFAKAYAPVDTGALRNSIEAYYPGGKVIAGVQDGVEYGVYQEFGHHAPDGSFVAAQPFIQPAIIRVAPEFEREGTWSLIFR